MNKTLDKIRKGLKTIKGGKKKQRLMLKTKTKTALSSDYLHFT